MPRKKRKKKYVKKKKYARTGKILNTTLYTYVEKENFEHAVYCGKDPRFGTTSAFVNALLAKDRGVKPARGTKNQMVDKKQVFVVDPATHELVCA